MFGLIFVYLLTAIGVVGSLGRPVIGLFVYVLFAMLRPQYMWSFAGNMAGMSQLVGVAMLVGWGLKGFGGFKLGAGRTIVTALLLFTGWAWVSARLGINPDRSDAWVLELAKIVAPFLVGVTLLNTRKLVWAMLWVIVACHGYIAYDMNNWYYLRGFNFVRENGYGYMDNNSFGLSLVTAMGLAIGLALAAKKWPERALALVCSALILSTVVLTYSRGSLLGLMVVGGAAAFLIPKKPAYLALMLVGLLVGGRLMGAQVIERFSTVFAEEEDRDASAQSRVDLWQACLDIGSNNPIFGIGPRNFPSVAERYGFTAGKEAHSTWMQTVAEMGFVGVILLLVFYLSAILKLLPLVLRRWTDDTKEESAMAAGILIALSGFFVSAQFVTMVGLEAPYYVAMAAVAIVKTQVLPEPTAVAVPFSRTRSITPVTRATVRASASVRAARR